jgi:predicted secreted protein
MMMRWRIFLALAAIAVSLLLLSCITSHDFSAKVSCDQFAANGHRSTEFEVEVGDKIRVELCSNPTTGFGWTYEMDGDTVLREEDRDFAEAENEGVVGAPGKDLWTFEATGEGTTEVLMEYSQPWDGGTKAEWTFTMTVTVK